ncbi:zinc finger, CCHC-type containing protein [Tanacetum coccineum]
MTKESGDTSKKEVGTTSTPQFQCPILKPSNYSLWAIRMQIILEANGLWEMIEPNEKTQADNKKDKTAMAFLYQALPEEQLLQITKYKTAKTIWDALKTRHIGEERIQQARLQTLKSDFEMLHMKEDETIDTFTTKLTTLVNKAASLGHTMEDETLVRKLLNAVPDRYLQIVASIEQYSDLSEMTLEEAIGRLKTYEERIKYKKGKQVDNQEKLMFTRHENKGKYFRGRGRGKHRFSQERNHENFKGERKDGETSHRSYNKINFKKSNYDTSKLRCYKCKEIGHIAPKCPQKKKSNEQSNLIEEDLEPTLLMAILEDEEEQNVSLQEEDVGYKEINKDSLWYLDNGASNHMTEIREHFKELDEKVSGKVRFGDGSYIEIKGKGSILIKCDDEKQRIISHVYYIPDLKSNLLSLGQFTEIGCKVVMEDDELQLYDMDNKIFIRVTRQRNRLYKANLRIGTPVCLLANLKDDSWLWHARLGHLNFESLKSMAQKDLVHGIPTIKHTTQICDVCLIGKHSRTPFPKKSKARSTSPLDLVYGDLCGPITPPTPSGKKYIFLLVDDYSRYMWVYFLTTKDQAFDTFKEFKKSIENELRTTLKMLRTDRGGEFTSNEFMQYCKENGIARQLTAPYSPQQNGVVERRNRTIMSMTRCMMKATNLPQNFWAEAVRHAIYILNSVPTKALEDITPYEAIKQRKPNLENLRVFGCIAYAKVPSQHLTKLDDRSTRMVYLGNEQGSKAYRLFDPTTQRICVSRDVKFKENETWDWKDYMSELINDEPEWTDFRIGDLEATNEHHDQGFQPIEEDNEFPNNDDDDYVSPTRDSPSHSQTPHTPSTSSSQVNSQVTPNTSTQSYYQSDNDSTQVINSPSHFDHTPLRGFRTLSDLYENTEELLLAEDEPKNYKEASSDQKWIEAMKVELDSINRNNTWELTTLPKGHKAIGLKWVFKTKKDANGNIIKHKARLVAKGYIQQHGIDFEEVFAPVARMETIRLLLAIAANNKWEVHHLDVKSAFLHGDLKEEVYVTQPEGFIKRQDNGKVYRLIKALYGLRQAPRAWNIKLDNTLKSLDFKKCALEQAIYTKKSKDSILLIGVYVDDLIITGTPKKEIDKFKAQMEEKFEMSDLGLLAYYLGIEVTQTNGDISIKQSAYASKILKEAGMIDCNETLIPMDPGTRLTKITEGTMVNSTEYRSLIGCLRYLLHTRPDLSYSVGLLSRFMQEPREQHMKAIRQVLRYVQGTKDHGITYKHNRGNKIHGYSDSSYGVNTQEGKGTTGIIFYYGESPISWSTQKQATVALSSCESEFIAATAAATQALWLKRLLSGYNRVNTTEGKGTTSIIFYYGESPISWSTQKQIKHIDTNSLHQRKH